MDANPCIFILRLRTEVDISALKSKLVMNQAIACDCAKLSAKLGFDLHELIDAIARDFGPQRSQRQLALRESFAQVIAPMGASKLMAELSILEPQSFRAVNKIALLGDRFAWAAQGIVVCDRFLAQAQAARGAQLEMQARGGSRMAIGLNLFSECDGFEIPEASWGQTDEMLRDLAAARLSIMADSRQISASCNSPEAAATTTGFRI